MAVGKHGKDERRCLVIDCDPGCDDALAILMAIVFGNYTNIEIATVAGNVGILQTTSNAHRIVALARTYGVGAECRIRIWRGAAAPLGGNEPSAASVHGRDGLGDVPLRALVTEEKQSAFWKELKAIQGTRSADKLYDDAPREHRNSRPDLVCSGPLTNVARALLRLPAGERKRFFKRWRRIVVMGGAIDVPGNISYASEFNAHADPEALRIVLQSWNEDLADAKDANQEVTPLVFLPLDITERIVFSDEMLGADPFNEAGALGRAVLCLLRKYFLFHAVNYDPPYYKEWRDDDDAKKDARDKIRKCFESARRRAKGGMKELPRWCFLHDPTAMWAAMNWDKAQKNIETRRVRIGVATGDYRGHVLPATGRNFFLAGDDAADIRGDLLELRLFRPRPDALASLREPNDKPSDSPVSAVNQLLRK